MAEEAREGVQIKQEEELQKREKTLMDEEAAQMEREKLHEKIPLYHQDLDNYNFTVDWKTPSRI